MNRSVTLFTLACMFAALIAAGAVFSLPLPPPLPPVTLAVFFGIQAGLVLGPWWAGLSVLSYLLLGSLGLPVFANASGGLGHFAGPTGGFLLGYLPLAMVAGFLADRRKWTFARSLAGGLAGVAALYLVGLPWFRAAMDARVDGQLSIWSALAMMAPYLAGDAVKAVLAAALVRALKPLLANRLPAPARPNRRQA